MSKKKNSGGDEPSAPFWMLTYGDVMTLLLAFFVMLLSFSSMQEAKFHQAMGALQAALGVLNSSDAVFETPASTGEKPMEDIPLVEDTMKEVAEAMAAMDSLDSEVDVIPTSEGYAIRMSSPVLFDLASADLKPAGQSILEKITGKLRATAETIRVEGHTDNVPIHTVTFPSNWELSTARALSVLKFLNRGGIEPERLSAVGYGEFRPLVDNDTQEHRDINRRVEIYVSTQSKDAQTSSDDSELLWR